MVDKKIYSAKQINTTAPNQKEQWLKIDKGLYVVVAPEPTNSRRVVGKVVINKEPFKYNFGSFHINLKESDIDLYKSKWLERRTWAKDNKCDPNLFDVKNQIKKSDKTISEIFELFREWKVTQVRDITTIKNRLNKILRYVDGNSLISDFQGNAGRRYFIETVIDPFKNKGTKYEASKIRKQLNQVFNFAVSEAYLEPELMPYGLDTQLTWETKLPSNPHPHLSWEDFRDQLIPKLSSNSSSSGRLANLATKASILTCLRVSTVVCWRWDWFDPEINCWVIPAATDGLKRSIENMNNSEYDHYVPQTPQLEVLMNYLHQINGQKEYAFFSPFKGNNPYLSKSTPNDVLKQLGFQGLQDAHGLRHVASTALCEDGFDELMVGRCLSHTNKSGVMKHYNFAKYIEPRRKIHERWNSLLIENGLRI